MQGGKVIDPTQGLDAVWAAAVSSGHIARIAAVIEAARAHQVVELQG